MLRAQNLTGEIDGVVHDSSGAVVPNATVTIRNTDQNLVERSVSSDGQGQFTAPLLAIGNYSVTVEATGFETSTVSGVASPREPAYLCSVSPIVRQDCTDGQCHRKSCSSAD